MAGVDYGGQKRQVHPFNFTIAGKNFLVIRVKILGRIHFSLYGGTSHRQLLEFIEPTDVVAYLTNRGYEGFDEKGLIDNLEKYITNYN